MYTDTIDLPIFFASHPPSPDMHSDAKRTCHMRSNNASDPFHRPPTGDRKRFPVIEKAAAECIIWMGGRASFQIICEHVSNVLALRHKRDFPASKLYYAAIQACLSNASDVFVREPRNMWSLTENVRKKGEKMFLLRRQSTSASHLTKLTNKLILGVTPSFQLSDLGDDADDADEQSMAQGDTTDYTAHQRKPPANKKRPAMQKTPRKKGNAGNNSNSNANRIESIQPIPQFSSAVAAVMDVSAKGSASNTSDAKKLVNEAVVDVKKEKDEDNKQMEVVTSQTSNTITVSSQKVENKEQSSTESTGEKSGQQQQQQQQQSDVNVKKEEDAQNRQSQCAFCGKQIQVAKRYVFYTAEDGKDDDYIGGKRNALGKRKYPDSGHVCNDCYKCNGAALRKEEKDEEPDPKKRRTNKLIVDDDDDDDDDVNMGDSNQNEAQNETKVDVKTDIEEDKKVLKEDKGDKLTDVNLDIKNVEEKKKPNDEVKGKTDVKDSEENVKSETVMKEEKDVKENESDASLQTLQRMIAAFMYSKVKEDEAGKENVKEEGGDSNGSKYGVTEEEIKNYITQVISSLTTENKTQANFSSQELPILIPKALEFMTIQFKFVKNGNLWYLDVKHSDLTVLKNL